MPRTTAASWLRAGCGRRRSRRLWGAGVAAATGLGVGDTFIGSHGLAPGGPTHADEVYTVVGVLAPTTSVLDRLVLTPIESVWLVHGQEPPHREAAASDAGPEEAHSAETGGHDPDEQRGHAEPDDHAHELEAEGRELAQAFARPAPRLEVTSLLLRFNSPLAAVQLPRLVNQQSALQAASPAFETARLLALVGVGVDTLRGFGVLLIATAGLSVFIALSNAMQERRYDLAVMRTLGASRRQLFSQPLLEALILAGAGALLGIVLGHLVAELAGRLLPEARNMGLGGFVWLPEELYAFLLALGVGLLAALLPAIQAYRTDIAAVLASRA